MQRTNTSQTALVFISLTLLAVAALCGLFLLTGWSLPDWIILVGRWIPALVSLAVMRLLPLPGGLRTWWSLRPGGRRRFLLGTIVAVGTLLGAYALTVMLAAVTGIAVPLPFDELAPILLILVPAIAVYSLSTFGEEVAWRGYLQRLLRHWGFWRSAAAVAGVWVLFHVPLHGTLALQGTLPMHILASTTLLLFPMGLFLSAAVARFGSIWPAVFAHALPLSAFNLIRDPDLLNPGQFWAFTALAAAVLGASAILLAPRPGQPISSRIRNNPQHVV